MTVSWDEVKSVFDEAVELPRDRRARLLEEACHGDAELLGEVEALLEADEQAGDFLETPAAPEPLLREGRLFGPWRLLRELGEGGMGKVFLAERADGAFQQRVAIKLLKATMSGEAHRRFVQERQILARLEHPNIARLIDGGTEGGVPYIVMEHVEGQPITAFAGAAPVHARLRLLLDVCGAVSFAHRNLVVHRDLKPSNVLVTQAGVVKLLDFGIAKLLDHDGGELTHTRARLMTPEYAAPEQVAGKPVTTATDVYGLGLVLYEVLAGKRPFGASAPARLEQAVLTEEPRLPSAVAASREVAREVRGDLDRICLMALEKEPDRRYASVEALADDFRRHLSGQPVLARGTARLYRLTRFARRNRLGLSAAALVGAAIAAGVMGTAWQARRADREARQAEAVSRFLLSLFEASQPEQLKGEPVTARDLLDRGAERAERELSAQPEAQERVLWEILAVYLALEENVRAENLARKDIALRERLYGAGSMEAAAGNVQLAEALFAQERYVEAEQGYADALAIAERHGAVETKTGADALWGIGATRFQLGDLPAAERYRKQTVELRRRLGGEHTELYAGAINSLGLQYISLGRYGDAQPLIAESAKTFRDLLGLENPNTLTVLFNLSIVEDQLGHLGRAEQIIAEILPVQSKLLGPDHPGTTMSMRQKAVLLAERGAYSEAEELFSDVARRMAASGGEDGVRVSVVRLNWSNARRAGGDLDGAAEVARAALDAFEKRFGRAHTNSIWSVAVLAEALIAAGRHADAEELLARFDPSKASPVHAVAFWSVAGEGARRSGRAEVARERLGRAVSAAREGGIERSREAVIAGGRLAAVGGDAAAAGRAADELATLLPAGHPAVLELRGLVPKRE